MKLNNLSKVTFTVVRGIASNSKYIIIIPQNFVCLLHKTIVKTKNYG